MKKLLVIFVLVLAGITSSRAVITLQHDFHLGDLDTDAIGGSPTASGSVDGITLQSMVMVGSPGYVTDVPPDYPFVDTCSMDFNGTNYGWSGPLVQTSTNFGLSVWVKPRSLSGNQCIAYNGDTTTNGWGLYQVGNTFQVLLGGVEFIGSAPVTTNVWTQLAMVCNGGVTTLYMNGVAYGSDTNLPNLPGGDWAIAAAPPALNADFFDGRIDEVYMFTFDPGAFSPGDLPYAPPSARTLSATNGVGGWSVVWPTNQPFMQLQVTTDLMNWTNVAYTANASSQFTAAVTPGGPAQFYRLAKQPNLNAPFTTTVTLVRKPGSKVAFNPATTTLSMQLASLATAFTFTANVLNPLTGISDGGSYHWVITYSDTSGSFTDAGIQGYRAQTLVIDKGALRQTSGGASTSITLAFVPLVQIDQLPNWTFPITVSDSVLTLSVYNGCQSLACDDGINSPGCNCTIPAALPVNVTTDPP